MAPILLTPGPVEVDREVLESLSRRIISHRGGEFRRLYESVVDKLARVYCLREGSVVVMAGSGTTAVDSMLWSLTGERDRVLVLVHGEFGLRAAESLERGGRVVDRLVVGPGEAVIIKRVVERLDEGGYDAVVLIHNETSTGVFYPWLEELARIADERGVRLLVDSVSSLGGMPFSMYSGLWASASTSHKALGAPPGASFVALSSEAIEYLSKNRGDARIPPAIDLSRYIRYAARSETPFTPPVNLLYALDTALDKLLSKGLDYSIEEHRSRASLVYEGLEKLGFTPVPLSYELRSNTVTAFWSPLDAVDLKRRLEERGYIIATGMGAYKRKMIRVGVMGAVSASHIKGFVGAVEDIVGGRSYS